MRVFGFVRSDEGEEKPAYCKFIYLYKYMDSRGHIECMMASASQHMELCVPSGLCASPLFRAHILSVSLCVNGYRLAIHLSASAELGRYIFMRVRGLWLLCGYKHILSCSAHNNLIYTRARSIYSKICVLCTLD